MRNFEYLEEGRLKPTMLRGLLIVCFIAYTFGLLVRLLWLLPIQPPCP
jgi:hypothetical protein